MLTWTYDAPSGTFKQHALSKRLMRTSLEESHFMAYVRPVDGFGKNKGEQVTIVRLGAISEPTSALLSEGTRIPEDVVNLSTKTITVAEYGRALPFTNLILELSAFDLEQPIQAELVNQQKLTLDTAAAVAFKSSLIKYTPTGAATRTIDTAGSAAAVVGSNMNMFHVEEIADYLYDTLRATPWSGDDFVGVFRTKSLRGIKRDPAWEQWKVYTNPEAKSTGEVGRVENVRFVKTNHNNALGLKGASSQLGEGVVFGKDAVALAEAVTPELRMGRPEDFGRSRSVAWYGILAFGLIWDTGNAGEAKVVHVTGAAS
jgi:N4-gp56 family major capsid protein